MNFNQKVFKFFNDYLLSFKKDVLLEDFGFSYYVHHRQMFNINNELPEILIGLDNSSKNVYLRSLSLIKRNPDPSFACSFIMDYKHYSDIIGRTSFFNSKKILIEKGLLIKTPNPSVMIVHIKYANKLSKPKLEL